MTQVGAARSHYNILVVANAMLMALDVAFANPHTHTSTPHITNYFNVKDSFEDLQSKHGDSICLNPVNNMRTTFVNLDAMRNNLEEIDYNLSIMQEYNSKVFG